MIRIMLAAIAVAGIGTTSFGQWREVAIYEAPPEFDPGSPRFGAAMARDGGTILVGANTDPRLGRNAGAVEVFGFDADDRIVRQQTLFGSDTGAGDAFGSGVAVSGDRAIVAASFKDFDVGHGSVYFFERNSSGEWSETAALRPRVVGDDALVGACVAIQDEWAFVGVLNDEASGERAGTIYAYRLIEGDWTQTQEIFGLDGLGFSIAVDDGRLLIGAPGNSTIAERAGVGLLYVLSDGEWIFEAALRASEPMPGDQLGLRVDLDGDLAVLSTNCWLCVGDRPDRDYPVLVFERRVDGWEQIAALSPSAPAQDAYFGHDVAVNGNQLAISSLGQPGGTHARFYEVSQGAVRPTSRLSVPADSIRQNVGKQIDLSGNEFLSTSFRLSSFGRPDGGSLQQYVFCAADLDGDGELTIFDFLAFQNAFDAMDPVADFDGDGDFTIFDFLAFQNAFDAGCP